MMSRAGNGSCLHRLCVVHAISIYADRSGGLHHASIIQESCALQAEDQSCFGRLKRTCQPLQPPTALGVDEFYLSIRQQANKAALPMRRDIVNLPGIPALRLFFVMHKRTMVPGKR